MYALETGVALPERSADTNALLGALMKQLEARVFGALRLRGHAHLCARSARQRPTLQLRCAPSSARTTRAQLRAR
jgi:hypothetical protein